MWASAVSHLLPELHTHQGRGNQGLVPTSYGTSPLLQDPGRGWEEGGAAIYILALTVSASGHGFRHSVGP